MHQKSVAKTGMLIYYWKEKGKRHYVLIKDFNTFMYDHTLHRGRKHFYCYYLHAFSTEKILKRHIKDCFKINGKQTIIMPKKVNMLNSKILKEKSIIIYDLCRI